MTPIIVFKRLNFKLLYCGQKQLLNVYKALQTKFNLNLKVTCSALSCTRYTEPITYRCVRHNERRDFSTNQSNDSNDHDKYVNQSDFSENRHSINRPENFFHKEIEIEDFTLDEPEIPEYSGTGDDGTSNDYSNSLLPRGLEGVFDLEELVTLLHENRIQDLCVLRVPKHCHYVDYMVVGTCRSSRHVHALAEIVRVVYKRKRETGDPKFVRIEGELDERWAAIDLGNIALHLFLQETRELYDLESLWSLGEDYDEQCQKIEDDSSTQGLIYNECEIEWSLSDQNLGQHESDVQSSHGLVSTDENYISDHDKRTV